MSALSDALNEANVNRWSSRDIQRRSGDRINHATVAKYLNGSHGTPTESVLSIFSEVFGIPLPKLRRLAGLPAGERAPYAPPAEADRLNARQRRAVNELIRLLAGASEEEGGEHEQRSSAPIARESRTRPEPTVAQLEEQLRAGLADAKSDEERAHIEGLLADVTKAREVVSDPGRSASA